MTQSSKPPKQSKAKISQTMSIIDGKVATYINGFYKPLNPLLEKLRSQAEKENIPIILRETESLLLALLEMNKPKRILEIGTAVGYSALFFAMTVPDSHITSLELQERLKKRAEANIFEAGKDSQIHILQGDALETLELLGDELDTGKIIPIDFIFIDGAKGHYRKLWDLCIKLCKIGTVIVADNILYKAMTASDEYLDCRRNKTIVNGMRVYLDHVTEIPGVATTVLPVGDGVAISVIKSS